MYISPLKALNNDIHRNLQLPLEGVTNAARDMGLSLPALEVAVRTGDTPAAERRRLIRKPPHILITTPESLHLSADLPRHGRRCVRSRTASWTRSTLFAPTNAASSPRCLLERLAALTPAGLVRIGLSATQRPLEEVARFLGGSDDGLQRRGRSTSSTAASARTSTYGGDAGGAIWGPAGAIDLAVDLPLARQLDPPAPLDASSSPITAAPLSGSRLVSMRQSETTPGNCRWLAPITAASSLEVRQQTEQALKEGRLPAVVSTASLELGIDMGAVDLVCQVESPGNIARALQRVGRAGHLVGQRSKGRLIPKMPGDLLEQAVLAREMTAGNVEPLRVPTNCLDILAQQIVAMVAIDDWHVNDLFSAVRRAYPFRNLTAQALDTVLEMLSGRYRFPPAEPPI